MKLHQTLRVALPLVAFSVTCLAQEAQPSDAEKTSKAQIDAYVAAFNKGDTKALASMYTEDVQYSTDEGTEVSGRAAVVEGLNKYLTRNKGAKLALTVESARFLTPDVLVERGYATLGTAGGEPEVTRYTATYLKKDSGWLIAQLDEVTLPPVDAASQALGDLAWMVGTWKDNTPDITVETKVNWTKNQRFLKRSFTITREGEDPVEGTEVIGYDPVQGRIRSWIFDSEGGFGETVWRRDGNKWLIQSSATAADGTQTTAEHIITANEEKKFSWESINRVRGGEALPNIDKIEVVRTSNE
jgi:uncharacterized protein (TIGR02246 family)